MGEKYEQNLNQTKEQTAASDPHADIEEMDAGQLAALIESLDRQIREAVRTEPKWAEELEERRDRAQAQLDTISGA